MRDENDRTRPPGGTGFADDRGVQGVDYEDKLIPWCKGNSVSVDQTTLQIYRNIMSALFENYKNRCAWVDAFPKSHEINRESGITADELEKLLVTKAGTSRVTRKYGAAGAVQDEYKEAERLFQQLLKLDAIELYNRDNQRDPYTDEIKKRMQADDWGSNPGIWMRQGVCSFLLQTRDFGGHVRLSREFGWETYIRDHFGAPNGIEGLIPGSLRSHNSRGIEQTMPIPLHICLAETIARAQGKGDSNDPWGVNQSKIRRDIADLAIEGEGDRIALDSYYHIFAQHNAAHMADSFFIRSVSDKAAAKYQLELVPNSEPRRWDVLLEPEFVRWRELRRNRERLQ